MQKALPISRYFEKRLLSIYTLGLASGLPWVMIGSALSLWLKESGISRSEIGYAGLIYAVYSVNFFWSPLVDRVKLPFFSQNLHQRQTWIAPCQILIALACFSLYFFSPNDNAKIVVLIALFIALCSSTQDIAIDAYRIDSFSKDDKKGNAKAAAAATAGWWSGYAALGFLPLYLSDKNWTWPELYSVLGSLALILALISRMLPHPRYSELKPTPGDNPYLRVVSSLPMRKKTAFCLLMLSPLLLAAWALVNSPGMPDTLTDHAAYIPSLILLGMFLIAICIYVLTCLSKTPIVTPPQATKKIDTYIATFLISFSAPIQDFFARNEIRIAIQVLLFIFLFKVGEAFLGRMSIVFYKEIGFSNTDIASYSKMLTWWVTIISAVIAGALNARLGMLKSLAISGLAMACSNLMFAWIAAVGPSIPLYIATIIVDGFAAAWSLVAFVAFISTLCNHRFSASQYALLASLGALSRTMLSSLSGFMIDSLNGNWVLFFIITTLMVAPSMLLLWNLRNKINVD